MSLRIAIVGGGLGGLAAALFLLRSGHDVTVYEQTSELREVGAGIVVAPNMVRPWLDLGLGPALERQAVRLDAAWEFRRWQNGRVLSSQPMGEQCAQMYGAHCYVAHRADLLGMLIDALPPGVLKLSHRCAAIEHSAHGATLRFGAKNGVDTSGTAGMAADVVIGADGIHSLARQAVGATDQARFSGLCAFRFLVPAEQAPDMALRPVQTLWLGPDRHFVHYPISAGRLVNIVAIVPAGDWRTESWTADGDIAEVLQHFAGWDPRVLQMINSATRTKRWALYDREPLGNWTQGRVALLGDAAHSMLPFFAQGAAQALEDAVVLAQCLHGTQAGDVPEALQRYEARRKPRANQVQLMSRGREIRNHLPDGPAQQQRDAELASGDPLRQSAWLYGHDVLNEREVVA